MGKLTRSSVRGEPSAAQLRWVNSWLDAVVAGEATMSQRKLTSIDKLAGGIAAVTALARARGAHLVQLTDDKGDMLVAASMQPFKTLT